MLSIFVFVNIQLIILGNHSNENHGLSSHSSYRHHGPSDGVRHSFSSVASGGGGNGRHPNNNYNKETRGIVLLKRRSFSFVRCQPKF